MLLRTRRRGAGRLRPGRPGDGDRGSALVTVIGIAAVVAVVTTTLVASVTFASGTSAHARAQVQAQATAEDAIDSTLAQMSTYAHGSEGSFPCALDYTEVTGSGSAQAHVTLRYRTEGSAALVCPVASSATVVEAEVLATATVDVPTADGPRTATRTVKQRLAAQPAGESSSLFSYGVFSNGDLSVTNSFTVTGGGVHTNGAYACSRAGTVVGPVTAVGSVSLTNSCLTKDVHAGGTFTCDSGPVVTGDVEAAGTGTSRMSNSCQVTGSVTTGGPVSITTSTPRIGGNLVSAGGPISVSNTGPIVAGYGRAATTITVGDSGSAGKVFAGGYTGGSPSAVPSVPQLQTMPAITWADLTPAGTAVQSWTSFLSQNAVANNAPTWSKAYLGTTCDAERAGYSLGGDLTGPASATVLDARTCDVKMQGESASKPLVLTLRADLTIVAKSFATSNGVRVASTKTGPDAKLRIIVPVAPGAATCSAATAGAGNITLVNSVVLDPNVDAMLYTNGTVTLTNSTTIHGSVYGCTTNTSVSTSITYTDMTPPGMEGPDDGLYTFEETARYNLDGGGGT